MSDNGMFVFLGAMRPFQPAVPASFTTVPQPALPYGATAPVPGPQQLSTYRISHCARFKAKPGTPLTRTELAWWCNNQKPFSATESQAKMLFTNSVPGGIPVNVEYEHVGTLYRKTSGGGWILVATQPPEYMSDPDFQKFW